MLSLDQAGFAAEVDEPGPTYSDNALAKAATVSTALGLPALGDDSGIEIEALHGWPGPASARWLGARASDEDRMRALLAEVDRALRELFSHPAFIPVVIWAVVVIIIVVTLARALGLLGMDPQIPRLR